MKENFSTRLKHLRIEKGLTVEDLSKKTGYSRAGIQYWESNQRVPNANVVITFAQFFDVTTDFILGLTD